MTILPWKLLLAVLVKSFLAIPIRRLPMMTILTGLLLIAAAALLLGLLTMGMVQLLWWLTKPLRKNPLTMRRETRPPRTP